MPDSRRTTQIVESTGQSAVFWGVVLGIFQGFVWPVYVTYHVLDLLAV